MSRPFSQPLFFAARRHGIAYLQVPKVACTSFKVAIALLNQPELRDDLTAKPTAIHARREWNDLIAANDRALKKLYRFTFVRNPVARFLSFYQNKIWQPPRGSLLPDMEKAGFRMRMAIGDVLDIVEKTPAGSLDPHAAPQSWVVFDGAKPLVDFIGHIERLDEGMEKIRAATGLALELPHANKGVPSTEPVPEPTPDEVARIRRFFCEDFEKLGYASE
jgi:hypothetical protein